MSEMDLSFNESADSDDGEDNRGSLAQVNEQSEASGGTPLLELLNPKLLVAGSVWATLMSVMMFNRIAQALTQTYITDLPIAFYIVALTTATVALVMAIADQNGDS